MVVVFDKPNGSISLLQTQLSHRERHAARRLGEEALPLDEDMKGGHGAGEADVAGLPAPLHHLLAVANHGQPGEPRLPQQALLPRPTLAEFAVGRSARGGLDTGSAQANPPAINWAHEPLHGVIRASGAGTGPPHNPHQRVLNASAPLQPHVPSGSLTLSVGVYTGSWFPPGTPGGCLMHPAPWTAPEQAAYTGEARLETGRRPAALPLLPPRVESQPPAPPTAPHRPLGRGTRAPQGAPPRAGVFMPRPSPQPARTVASTRGRCLLRLCLRRSRGCLCCTTSAPCHLARAIDNTAAVDQGPGARVVRSSSPPATASVGVVRVRPALWALRRARHRARRVAVGSSWAATSRPGYRCPAQRHQPRHARAAPAGCRRQRSPLQGWPASVARGKVAGWSRTPTSACWRPPWPPCGERPRRGPPR